MTPAGNMLGLCARAGKLIYGEKAVVQAVRANGASLAVLDVDAAANAVKSVSRACENHAVRLIRLQDLGEAVGKPGRMAVAVTDPGMARRILELYESYEMTDG